MSFFQSKPKFDFSPTGGITPGQGQKYLDAADPNVYGGLGGNPVLKARKAQYLSVLGGGDVLGKNSEFGAVAADIKGQAAAQSRLDDRNAVSDPRNTNPDLAALMQKDTRANQADSTARNLGSAASQYVQGLGDSVANLTEQKRQRQLMGAQLAGQQADRYFAQYRAPTGYTNTGLSSLMGLGKFAESVAGAASGISGAFKPTKPGT